MARHINKNIVIVNEFTVNGSRGNSPGNYILEYMARDKASENLTPITTRSDKISGMEREITRAAKQAKADGTGLDATNGELPGFSDYITRYMAREAATEKLSNQDNATPDDLRKEFDDIQGMSGIAFAQDDLSLSHDEVKKRAKRIQAEYEKGKPVLKTVISFDTEYMKSMGVLPEDVEIKKRGDLYGKADQAKLRIAIQRGLKNIRHEFSDLDWIGVIQVDTLHLHCHLAMVDRGPGKRFTKDGEQKGMLDENMRMAIRRGIDNSLSECKEMKPLSIQMESERRNTVTFVKRFTHKLLEERGLPQFLLACLPKDDKSLWKAGVNTDGGPENSMVITKSGKTKIVRGNMKKANELTRSYVIDLLNRPESGFEDAIRAKHDYLMARRDRGDFDEYFVYRTTGHGKSKKSRKIKLTPDEAVREEEERFREEVIEKGMNAVYDILKTVDDDTMTLHTPLLDAMSMPYEDMASFIKEDKLIEFGFRLRSYSSRLEYHKKTFTDIADITRDYEASDPASHNPASKPLYDFLVIEREYNHALMCKYQSFLHFFHVREEYSDEYEDLMYLRHKSVARRKMRDDKLLARIKDPEKREKEGREIYGLDGAAFIGVNPDAIEDQIKLDDAEYANACVRFKDKLATMGLFYDEDSEKISQGMVYKFDDVKAFDLHHMSYDFTYDFKIALENVDNFVDMAYKRYNAYLKAKDYLDRSGQSDVLKGIVSEDDIFVAKEMADEFRVDRTYKTKFDDGSQMRRNSATIKLDHDIYDRLSGKNLTRSMREIIREMDVREDLDKDGDVDLADARLGKKR